MADEVSPDQEITALAWTLAAQGREPLLVFERVHGTKVATNIFASRARIGWTTSSSVSAGTHSGRISH